MRIQTPPLPGMGRDNDPEPERDMVWARSAPHTGFAPTGATPESAPQRATENGSEATSTVGR